MTKFLVPDKYRNRFRLHIRGPERESPRTRNALVMLLIATAILALVAGNQWSKISDRTASSEEQRPATVLPSSASKTAALAYIEAIQTRDFERVFQMTQWMQERIEFIRLESGPRVAQYEIETFYQQEKEDFFSAGSSELTEDGISDAHLFPQGAVVRVVEVREGLSRPVLDKGRPVNMVVMEVEYPVAVNAPTAANEKRIDRLRAALYITLEGKIIKASVHGNARVYPESVIYRHLMPSETRRIRAKGSEIVGPAARTFSPKPGLAPSDPGRQYVQAEGRS